MRTRSSVAAALIAAASIGCYEAPPPKQPKEGVTAESLEGKLRHRAMLTSSGSNFADPQLRLIQYPEDYDEMWAKGFTNVGGLQKPFVNFDNEMVIFVAAGTKPRAGFRIVVDSIVSGTELVVYVTEHEPGPNCSVTRGGLNRPTAPAQIVTIPWMEKSVRFVEGRAIGRAC
jgi:hypothetical protein